MGEEGLGVPDELRPACAALEPFEKYSRHSNAHRGTVLRFDEPGLSVGPRHEFRGGDWEEGGEDDDLIL